jgi:phospholipid/cholesterol/gamma-HCH transport system substrate-binding protein
VSIAGVIVGQVAEISLDQKSFTALVRMEIDSDVAELSIDSTAAILTEGLLGGKFIGLTIGADESYLKEGAYITDTQSSIVLEDMIGKFLMKQF